MFLTPEQLVDRYCGAITTTRLVNWRKARTGPPFIKIGGSIVYPLADVEAWERRNRINTNGKAPRTISATQKPAEACQ